MNTVGSQHSVVQCRVLKDEGILVVKWGRMRRTLSRGSEPSVNGKSDNLVFALVRGVAHTAHVAGALC